MWQIIDSRNFQSVKSGTHSTNAIMASLVGADPEDIINKVKKQVEDELKLLLDLEEVDKILLGE